MKEYKVKLFNDVAVTIFVEAGNRYKAEEIALETVRGEPEKYCLDPDGWVASAE